jgi:hypothetical protein
VLTKTPGCVDMLKATLLPYLIQLLSPAPEGKDEVIFGAREVRSSRCTVSIFEQAVVLISSCCALLQASVQLLAMLVHATNDIQPTDLLLTKYASEWASVLFLHPPFTSHFSLHPPPTPGHSQRLYSSS